MFVVAIIVSVIALLVVMGVLKGLSAGRTPTMVYGSELRIILRPTTSFASPNRLFQSLLLMTATCGWPC